MRFYTKQHQFYCGIDLHARTMYLCILNQDGEILVHRNMPAGPEPFLQAVTPYREDLVVCVACLFTWYWLADLCVREEIPFVLGHELYRKAIHGGQAKNDKIAAQKIAVLLRAGLLPQADVSPAAMRATRDPPRRRMPPIRRRAAVLGHLQTTPSQARLPDVARFPRVQHFVSSCRRVRCAKASAGKRYGTSGTQTGHASLTWAFSEAAVLCLRNRPAGQK